MNYIQLTQMIVALLLIISILLQNRGSGIGMAFGGEGNVYRTKRGIEKGLFWCTIVLSVIFFGLALWNVLNSKI